MKPEDLCWEKKHPHGRGEDGIRGQFITQVTETPPRAWGRRLRDLRPIAFSGNTPTGVGKTNFASGKEG